MMAGGGNVGSNTRQIYMLTCRLLETELHKLVGSLQRAISSGKLTKEVFIDIEESFDNVSFEP